MHQQFHDLWLVAIGVTYAGVAIGWQSLSGGVLVSWEWTSTIIIGLCSLAGVVALGVWVAGATFHRWAPVFFVAWLVTVVVIQLSILASAAASA